MGLGKRKSSNGLLSRLKYDPRAGMFYRCNRVYENGEWQADDKNIERKVFRAIFDLPNAQKGWLAFLKGVGPDFKLVSVGEDVGERPSENHQEGVRIIVQLADEVGPRELVSTDRLFWDSISKLHDAYLAGAKKHADKLPMVGVAENEEIQTNNGPSYVPVFEILDWVPRPDDLPLVGIPFVVRAKKETASAPMPKPATTSKSEPTPKTDDEIPF